MSTLTLFPKLRKLLNVPCNAIVYFGKQSMHQFQFLSDSRHLSSLFGFPWVLETHKFSHFLCQRTHVWNDRLLQLKQLIANPNPSWETIRRALCTATWRNWINKHINFGSWSRSLYVTAILHTFECYFDRRNNPSLTCHHEIGCNNMR